MPQSPFRLGLLLIPLALACFAFSPTAPAVSPALEGDYPKHNIVEAKDALFSLTTGADNTALGFNALDGNATGSENALASLIWTVDRRAPHATCFSHGDVATKRHGPCCVGIPRRDLQRFLGDRRTVRPGERHLDFDGQAEHPTFFAHGDVTTKRDGPGCRGNYKPLQSYRDRRTV